MKKLGVSYFKSRRFRKGSAAAAVTILVVAVFVVFNILVSSLSGRYGLRVDTSANKAFSLSEQSLELLESLDKDVEIYILNNEEGFLLNGTYFLQANEVMRQYGRHSSRVTVSYLDPVRSPMSIRPFASVDPKSNDIIVKCGDNLMKIEPLDLLNVVYTAEGGYVQSSKAEQAVSSAIVNVTSGETVKVSVLTGHGESGIGEEDSLYDFVKLLETNNYEVTTQNLVSEEIDPETSIAVICAPERDFGEAELKKLDAFLAGAGERTRLLFYLANGERQPETPVLDAFLADWGIGVGTGMVFDQSAMVVGLYDYNTYVQYSESEFSGYVIQKGLLSSAAYSRPLETLFDNRGSIYTTTLWNFSETAGVQPNDADEDWVPESGGPFPALILSQNHENNYFCGVLAGGTAEIIDGATLSNPNRGNSSYLIGLLNTACERESMMVIEDKSLGGTAMDVTGLQAIIFGAIFIILLPLAVLGLGIGIWLRRRHL